MVAFVDIGIELVEPFGTLWGIGSLQGYEAEAVDVTDFIVVDGTVDTSTDIGIGRDDVCCLQASYIKGFIGGIGDDPVTADSVGDRCERQEGTP